MTMHAQQPSPIPEPPPGGPMPPGMDPDGPVPIEEPPSADPEPLPGEDDVPPLRIVRSIKSKRRAQ